MKIRHDREWGFTLIEIMIVVSIMAVCLGIGVPSIFRAAKKDPLQQAVRDVIEACTNARSQAILRGESYDFVIRASEGSLSVIKSPARQHPAASGSSGNPNLRFGSGSDGVVHVSGAGSSSPAAAKPLFSGRLHEDIIIEILFVDLRDQMDRDETHIRFHPNSMSDEMRIVLNWRQQKRTMITLDPITAIADMDILQ